MDKKQKPRSTFSWIMEFAEQKKSDYAASVILAVLGAICQMLPYLVMAGIIQKLLDGNRDFHGYLMDCLLMAVFWLARILFHSFSTARSHVATFAVLGNIRRRGLEKLERMPLGDVQARGSGELKNILVERIESIETTLAHVIPEVTGNICVVLLTVVYLLTIDWRMTLVSLITVPVGLICFMLMMIGYEDNYGRTVRATKNLNDTAVEYIGGIEVIKIFGKARSSYEKFAVAAKESAASYVDWMKKCNVYFTFAMNIMPATLVTVLPIGGAMVRSGSLEVPDLVLVVILAMGLVGPIIGCMSYNDDLAKLRTIIGEVAGILAARELPRPDQDEEHPHGSTVQLRNVRFGYGEKEVLHSIDLTFKEGGVHALVGPSGGGKSTIAKLIAGYWDVDSGSIILGGADIRRISAEHYYSRIAYVSQDNFLFDTTIRENIRMGRQDATDREVEEAAKACGCYDFIMGLEHGFDTVAGSGGGHLSGGERQRICIARAMLKDAQIVILDEATAYTDPESEAVIQQSVARLVQGKTLIVIAHRLSTVTEADQIAVIRDGRIEETGKHQELLAKGGLYRELWEAHVSSRDSLTGGEAHV